MHYTIYELYGHALAHFTIFVDSSVVIITIYLIDWSIYRGGHFLKIQKMHFQYKTYDYTLAQESLLRGSWDLQYFVDPSLVIITIYSICDFCLGIRKIFQEKKRNYAFSLNNKWSCPSTRTPDLGFMKLTILVDHSLVVITNNRFVWSMFMNRKDDF